MRSSFLDYAMSVIVSRALPDVRDGLKPVHRRVLYGMHEDGLQPGRPYKKSRRDGRHGDEPLPPARRRVDLRHARSDGAAVLAALPARRRPGQLRLDRRRPAGGDALHRGAPVADRNRAAARHRRDTVDFEPNYDESRRQPSVLPSRFPNLLVNGSAGIAVGMATNIPPHHLGEVIDAVVAMIEKPDIDVEGLMKHIKGPDFPTGGYIVGRSGIRDAYRTGRGRDRDARARPHRGAARRQERDHRHRASVRRPQGRRRRRDREDRGPRREQGPDRDPDERRRARRPFGQGRHAHLHRAEARGDPAGRAEQALQAHAAADARSATTPSRSSTASRRRCRCSS